MSGGGKGPRGGGRKRRERVEGHAFMDVVREAFVRWFALEKWREIEDLRDAAGLDWPRALAEAGSFLGRGRYAPLWVARWREHLGGGGITPDPGGVFAAIERAVAEAFRDEEAERKARGDRPIEEDPEFKGFVDASMERLIRASRETETT